jgi:hypothetical protein
MIDYSNCSIDKISVHRIGNKTNGEELHLSNSLLDISDNKVRELLLKYFIDPFNNPEFYSFTFENDDFTENPLFKLSSQMFGDIKAFHNNSISIAKHLYEISVHPQIKSGDLFVVYFSGIILEDEFVEAIGIFKSENNQAFLKLESSFHDFLIGSDEGINTEKLDKGCLIFNHNLEAGFKVCVVDRSGKSVDAQFWRDNFLQLVPSSDNYHHTKNFMSMTKDFVTKHLPGEYELSRADQIDYLNRSAEYFKTHDKFDKKDFEKDIFKDERMIKSFRNYDEGNDEYERFDISPHAVKKQIKVFKSVLKLDNNFHVYIHGNRELIEHGVDKDGRKYYKLYFNKES